jgi:purine-binding chemotaxis protein CheW
MHPTTHAVEEGAGHPATQAGKYLTFLTGGLEYGLSVLKVREIIKAMDITAVPQVPPCVRGVINLRGKVIPVTDLRLKFGFPPQEATDQTCIIVVEVAATKGTMLVGLLVDGVSDVQNIQAQEIEEPPVFGPGIRTDYMRGIAKIKGSVKVLLDIDHVMNASELEAFAA